MTVSVAQMSRDELREMIEVALEQKLLELLGDPDGGLEIRESVRERLLRQQKAVAAGERGEPFEDVVRQLGLE
jgi:DNA-binding GntR family transcriptional regulator